MIKSCLLFLFFSLTTIAYSQDDAQKQKSIQYERIDATSKNIKYEGDLSQLVTALTQNCNTEFEKARAIFTWITFNISYDCKLFNNRKVEAFKCKDKYDCELKMQQWEQERLDRVIRKKKAICSGYAALYQEMCHIAGINCIVIEGYFKTEPSQIGRMGILDHAWNALIIDGNYYYLDATWAAGYCTKKDNGKLKDFKRKYNDYYWLTPIDKLSRNHFPKDTLQLVNSKYDKKAFKKNPFIENAVLADIEITSPDSGVIEAKVCDTIHFSFRYSKAIEKLQVNTNLARNPKVYQFVDGKWIFDETVLRKQHYITPEFKDGNYSFDYIVTNKSIRFIEILFDYRLALKYLVKVTN